MTAPFTPPNAGDSGSRPRRVLILNDQGARSGGAEIVSLELRDGLRSRGIDARLFASRAGSTPTTFEADYGCSGGTDEFRNARRLANPSARRALALALRDFVPDVVHVRMFTTQLSALILPLLRGVPTLYHASWYAAVCPNGLKLLPDGSRCREPAGMACLHHGCFSLPGWMAVMAQRKMLQEWWNVFDHVVANSEAVRTELEADGISPVEVIPNGTAVRDPRAPLTDPPTAAYAGRLSREKGVEELVRAFGAASRKVPNARLLIAGDGPERSALEKLAGTLEIGDRVAFVGHLDRGALDAHLAPAWVQVIPSLVAEPFGMAAIEAMMRGTAVVATTGGGVAEVVAPGTTGLHVAPGDIDDLTRALVGLLGHRSRAEHMGAQGRHRALSHYGHDALLDRFINLYGRLAPLR